MSLDLTKPVQTKDGRPARIVARDAPGSRPLTVLITNHDTTLNPQEWASCYRLDGGYNEEGTSGLDLINIPEPPPPPPAFGDTPEAKLAIEALAACVPHDILAEMSNCVNYHFLSFTRDNEAVKTLRRKAYFLLQQAILRKEEGEADLTELFTFEECRKALGLSVAEFARELRIDRKTYYNWTSSQPSRSKCATALRLANILVSRVHRIQVVLPPDEPAPLLAHNMPEVHRLRSFRPPLQWKTLASLSGVAPTTIQKRYLKWLRQQSSSPQTSPLRTCTHSTTAIEPLQLSATQSPPSRDSSMIEPTSPASLTTGSERPRPPCVTSASASSSSSSVVAH